MAQLLGRDLVVERIAAAVDRARAAGGGTVVVCGPGGVGTSAVVEVALRPFGMKVSCARRGSAGRRRCSLVDRRRSADAAGRCGAAGIGHGGHFSGRAPVGTCTARHDSRCCGARRGAGRPRVVDVAPLGPQDALAVVAGLSGHGWRDGEEAARALQLAAESGPCAPARGGARRRRGWAGRRCASPSTICW